MTEEEWLVSTDLGRMVRFRRRALGRAVLKRKQRLFICGCCRLIWGRLTERDSRLAVEVAERYADGLADYEQLKAAHLGAYPAVWRLAGTSRTVAGEAAIDATTTPAHLQMAVDHVVCCLAGLDAPDLARPDLTADVKREWKARRRAERERCCRLLRDVLGDPFHVPSPGSSWLRWNEGTIPKLARTIYVDRAFDQLGILADALEEAGCDDERVLAHCRSGGEHARGCWVVDDLLTGSSS